MTQQPEQPPQGMVEHHAFVSVKAPVHEVYEMFTHFTDFPKFMHFVREVHYIDGQHSRTHWVADVIGQHEWDAVDENWVPDQQIGWKSVSGLQNEGKVTFQSEGANQTRVDVYIDYNPPLGFLGEIGEKLGAGNRFEHDLQHDLENFARMVNEAPAGALNPDASNYLFHQGSAAVEEGKRSDATASNHPFTMDQPGTGVEQSTTSEQASMGQPAADYLAGGPVVGDDVVVETYEIDTLPPELRGQPVPNDTIETPPPNPTNPDMPPEGTVYPVSRSETSEGGETLPPQP